jgi:DNA-binding transcriptional ArsR family regulator
MSDEIIKFIAKVKRGYNRRKVLENIDKDVMPSELVKKIYGKFSNTSFNVVSRALGELRELKLVEIINPKERTGRMYRLTKKGEIIRREILK